MNLINLQTFLAIAETGSLIRASEQLHVTQSTVTARLQTLEDSIGQRLVTRHKTGATLTLPGIKLRRYAEVMLELWKQARQDTALPEGIDAVCNIGCHTDLHASLGQRLLDAIRVANPRVALSAWSGAATDLTHWMENGLVDVTLSYNSATPSGYHLHTLPDEILTLVSSRSNSPIRFDPHYVFVENGEEFGRDHAKFYSDADTAKLSFGNADWALSHILMNGGTAYLPKRLVADHLASGALHLLDAPEFTRKTYLIVNEKAAANWAWLPPLITSLQTT
jgi:DNA-binding transcriptional LysR family regulator